MEGAFCSTAYRGLPVVGGQPLPATHTPWQRRGSWSSLSLSLRSGSRAVGTRLRGKCRRCVSGFFMRTGSPWQTHCTRKEEDVFALLLTSAGGSGDSCQRDPLLHPRSIS
jgi:hypothetical protein